MGNLELCCAMDKHESLHSYLYACKLIDRWWYELVAGDPDNFFIVNNNEMFKGIKKRGFNVVLQNSIKATDDGSLSIYYGKKNLVYVNIETQKRYFDEQVKMLNAVFNILR